MDKNKLVLAISILLGCIILGGSYYISQLMKIKAEQEAKEESRQLLEACIDKAEKDRDDGLDYWLKNSPEIYIRTAPEILEHFEKDREACFKRYPVQ